MTNKNEIMELVKQKEEIETQINEKLGIVNDVDEQAAIDPIELNVMLYETLNRYNDLNKKYTDAVDSCEELYKLIERLHHISIVQGFKEMLYVDFLDLKNSNDSKTYEEFKNYVEITKKRPQVKYDLDKFHEAIKDIEFYHLHDEFFNNEYGWTSDERADGLDVYSCKNDFKKINDELEKVVN